MLDEVLTTLYTTPGSEAICNGATVVQQEGVRFQKGLPQFMWLNYVSMTIAYPLTGTLLQGVPVGDTFALVLRVHRALGNGNSDRLLKYGDEEVIDQVYWNYWDTLALEDTNESRIGPGVDRFCGYIDAEYELFKQFARDNYPAESLPDVVFDQPGLMYTFCSFDNAVGYTTRSDWTHHRAELIASLMTANCDDAPILQHTAFHWESLFAVTLPNGIPTVYALFDTSFQILLDYANANGGEFKY